MHKNSNDIWTVRQAGLQGCINWLFVVVLAGMVFGGAVAAVDYFWIPSELYLGHENLWWPIRRVPAALAVFVAAELAAGFIFTVTVAFFGYCLVRKIGGHRNKVGQGADAKLPELSQ